MKKLAYGLIAGTALVTAAGWAIAQHGQVPAPKVSIAAQPQAIPFELFRGNRVVVSAKLNGNVTEVILDTGAGVTTVDRAYARSIGLPQGTKITARGAGGTIDAQLVSGVTLEVGGMRFDDMSVAVMDLAPVARGIGRPMNVILGREFFNSAVISIDWAGNRLRVSPHGAAAPRPGAVALELKRKGPFNTIPVSFAGGEPVEALLDLGNGGALIVSKSDWGTRNGLSALRYAEGRSGGVGGLHPSRSTTLPEVTLAGRTFINVPTTLTEGANDHAAEKMTNVGIGLLKQFHVDLDLGRNRIYLTPRSDAPPFERDRAGIRADLLGGRLKISFVSPQGPAAAAGLKEGEEIVAVNGKAVTSDHYRQGDWSRGPAGTRVALKRAGGGEVLLTLRDYY